VTVVDKTPPLLKVPADMILEATGPATTVVIGTAVASDLVGVVSLSSDAPAAFPLGKTAVTWTAVDAAGNRTVAVQYVSVNDTTAPLLAGLADRTAEATGAAGAAVTFSVTATDLATATPKVSCIPASGSVFALGATTVACTARDVYGNSSSGSFVITVRDTTPPLLQVPASISVLLNTAPTAAAIQSFLSAATATDTVDPSVTVTVSALPSCGTVGPKTITFTARDDAGNTTQATATIVVSYGGSVFLPPVSLGKPFNLGSTVPVKFQLTDANGAPVTTATASLRLQQFDNNEPLGEPIDIESTSGADSGSYFRPSEGLYIYNLNTRPLKKGLYQVRATLDDGSVSTAWLALK